MSSKPIERAVAKEELKRLNDVLSEPYLLIGGLAVQQYDLARETQDIDLICDFPTVQRVLRLLYPMKEWKTIDNSEDDYRPSYRIKNRHHDRGEIVFGPKILERGAYTYLKWEELGKGAKPFRHKGGTLEKILVPPPHALAYSKLVSFVGRNEEYNDKLEQDLSDFSNLTNHFEFALSTFWDLLNRNDQHGRLIDQFRNRLSGFPRAVVEQSCLYCLSALFNGSSVVTASTTPSPPNVLLGGDKALSSDLKLLESQLQHFRKVWHHYLVTKIGGKAVWRYRSLDFSKTVVPGKLVATLTVPAPDTDSHSYTVEAFISAPRILFVQQATIGTEVPVIHVYPFATERFRSIIAGVAFLQSWDGEHLGVPALMSASAIDLGHANPSVGTVPDSAFEKLDELWQEQASKLGLFVTGRVR